MLRCPLGGGFPGVLVGEGEMLPILGWIFVGVQRVAQGRRCPVGGGFRGAVGGEHMKRCPF